ncbi:hypothetical protein Bca52824_005459 [Brassica carinata]|uniref:Core-2/I-branching beta-1,6-N-acetylglucosaminyltransferase family protein n=1 Tax=Brassica carinata TaxID=52824 RepID=A0A8X7WQS8_BRACI|nr:hypothetical protein Bca52824_005459 [Brassica carinata]
MQIISRVVKLEEGKENGISVRTGQYKAFRPKLLLILGLFLAVVVTIFIISVSTINYTGLQSVVTTVTSTFVPCREEDESNSLSRWIQPPLGVLMHNMTDEELLWRASFWPRRKGYPFKRVPKIAFMFLTKGPLPLASLWERFLKGHEGLYSVYVHPDPSYTAKFPADSVFYKRQIPSQVAEWGRMTMCNAEAASRQRAVRHLQRMVCSRLRVMHPTLQLHNDLHLLKPIEHGFMGAVDDPGPFGRGRYNENMEPEVPITKWRKGPQWFEVDRDLAATIVEDALYYPKFREFCRPACYSDEHYFPTMLTIEKPTALANRSVTWTDWSRGGPHPATFGEWDVTEKFFEKIFDGTNCTYNGRNTSVCYLFARKFAPSALVPLLRIAPKILGF